jgi:hypothetical protein
MAQQDYVGSLAQTSISYTTIIQTQTVPGQNYWQVGLFVDSVIDASNNLVSGYSINVPIPVTATNFSTVVKSGSPLYGWLSSFFGVNSISTVYIVVYNGTTHDIPSAHSALLTLAYFKMVFFGAGGETVQYQADVVALAGQQASNTLLTQTLVSSSSPTLLNPSGTGNGNLDNMIVASGYDALMTYSAVTSYNELLTAVGLAINSINPIGNPVGNDLDFWATGNLLPSTGSTSYVNLPVTSTTNLTNRKIGYFATVGDGSGNVYMNARLSLQGKVVTANWLVNYCNFVCSLKTATLLTTGNNYTFKNNETYQLILGLIYAVISPFQTSGLGRLSNFTVTAPPFASLPNTGGTVLTIPNAWTATYNDRIGTVSVNGTLSVTL